MSIIKDGKTYRTLEEQVYYLTKEQAKDEVDIQSNREDIISLGTQLENKQDKLTFDDVPTNGSNNPVKSDGIYDALATKQNTLTFDNTPTDGSNNPVKSDGIYDALATKEGKLTTTSVPDRSISRAIGFDASGLLGKRNVSGSITNGGTNIVTSGGVYNALQDKQDKLTTSSVNDGTLNKAIGFDSLGNLVKGEAPSGGTDDYDELNNIPIINQEEVQSLTAFSVGQIISNGTKIHFDTTKVSELTTFLQNLTYTQEGGMLEFLVITDGGFTFAAYDLSGMSLGQLLLVMDNNDATIVFGTQNGSLEDMSWTAGFNNIDANGDYAVDIDNDTEVQSVNATSGWNGNIVSVKSTSLTPIPSNGNYYRKPDGKIYYYSSNEYHEILANGLVNYDASIIENSTNAVQGGAVYTALGNKQDKLSPSITSGTLATMLGFDANNDLVLQSASDYLNKYLINSGTVQDFIGYDQDGNVVREYLRKTEALAIHYVNIVGTTLDILVQIYNDDSATAINSGIFTNYIDQNSNAAYNRFIPCNGTLEMSGTKYIVCGVASDYYNPNAYIIFKCIDTTTFTTTTVQFSKSNLPSLSYYDNRFQLE